MHVRERVVEAVLGLQGCVEEAGGESHGQGGKDAHDRMSRARPRGTTDSPGGSQEPQ
ncbi:hypothetical protein D3C71_2148110 [compost metagenome]